MHVTDFEQLDLQHDFKPMMEIIEQDEGYLQWIKMSRLTFGEWRIESYPPFREKYIKYVTTYDEDMFSFNAKVNAWLFKS